MSPVVAGLEASGVAVAWIAVARAGARTGVAIAVAAGRALATIATSAAAATTAADGVQFVCLKITHGVLLVACKGTARRTELIHVRGAAQPLRIERIGTGQNAPMCYRDCMLHDRQTERPHVGRERPVCFYSRSI